MAADHAGPCPMGVLVLAPLGRDGAVLGRLLGENGMTAVACRDAAEVAARLRDGAGAVLLTEEALTPPAAETLTRMLAGQPAWSDLPLLLLAGGRPPSPEGACAAAALRAAGNLTMLERPARALSVVTAVQAALRARQRQYQVRDLIERERAARAEAEAANRLKDEFLENVSHELRTPLSAILLWARLLSGGRVPQGQTADALGAIERGALAQARLIEDLLDVSRMKAGAFRLDVREGAAAPPVRAAVDLARPLAEAKGLRLDAVIDPATGAVRADPERLRQVVANLLSNAVKFTPPGGRVGVRLDRHNDHVRLQVTDTGKGIRPDFLPHVFERFRQAESGAARREGGLGLGLAIVHQLVEAQGGTITAQSMGEGRGATFTVLLPASQSAAAPEARPAAAAVRPASPASGQVRVLVVDDNADVAGSVAMLLEDLGYEVRTAQSAAQALEAARSFRPAVVLSDLGLPGMDGNELARRLRREPGLEGVLLVALSGRGGEEDRRASRAAGFDEYLVKPVGYAALRPLFTRLGSVRA